MDRLLQKDNIWTEVLINVNQEMLEDHKKDPSGDRGMKNNVKRDELVWH